MQFLLNSFISCFDLRSKANNLIETPRDKKVTHKKKEWQTFLPSWPSEQQGQTVTSAASQMLFKLTVTNGQQKQGMEI